ncbi:MAG: PEP-CTERM sorting domain-containing protein [Chthonomonadetes bacterium]|nr:PEP-CTERM sorting domain-containing protein [Chthonomonadetes bacterium]
MKESLKACFCLWVVAMGVLLLSSPRVYAVNLIVNGDFELGNVGFTSGYTYDASPPIQGSDCYAIGTNPSTWNPGWWSSFGDHTTGSGKMLIADGHRSPNQTLWQQTVHVAPNTSYYFSYWAASSYYYSPAVLRTTINGVQIGGDFQLPSQTGQWTQFQVVWNSGSATSATIRLVDINTNGFGNDFVLDDLSMQAIPEPGTMWLFATGVAAMALRPRKKG